MNRQRDEADVAIARPFDGGSFRTRSQQCAQEDQGDGSADNAGMAIPMGLSADQDHAHDRKMGGLPTELSGCDDNLRARFRTRIGRQTCIRLHRNIALYRLMNSI